MTFNSQVTRNDVIHAMTFLAVLFSFARIFSCCYVLQYSSANKAATNATHFIPPIYLRFAPATTYRTVLTTCRTVAIGSIIYFFSFMQESFAPRQQNLLSKPYPFGTNLIPH